MKKFYLLKILLSFPVFLMAQPYNNEWISFTNGQPLSSQQYYRINVWQEGIYRITYSDMVAAGVDTANWFQPSKFQLFHNGKEQFIEVVDNGQQGVFRTGDYIEFYGRTTDGELDNRLYDSVSSQPNPYYNLFNDTAAYFLTYNPAVNAAKRIIIENDTAFSGYTAMPYYFKEDLKQYTDDYNIGWRDIEKVADNSYTAGEGFFRDFKACSANQPFQEVFQISNLNGSEAEIEVVLAGANVDDHQVMIFVNSTQYIDNTFFQYEMRKYNFTANAITNGPLTVVIAPQPGANVYANYVHVSYIKIRYKRNYDLSGLALPQKLTASASAGKGLAVITNIAVPNPSLYILDDDTVKRVILKTNGASASGLIPLNNAYRHCIVTNSLTPFTMSNMVMSRVSNNGYFNNYKFLAGNKEFLIVSCKKLWNGALAYASYRDSTGHATILADIDELYDQFSWGIRKHPIAIRNYCDYLLDQLSPQPKFLFLLGKSVNSMLSRSGNNFSLNLVPTHGEPSSDQMFTAKLNSPQFKPEIATGRLSAQSDVDIFNYLDKLRQYETAQTQFPASWMKRILHFGGGTNADEQADLAFRLNKYKNIIEDTLFGGQVTTFLKNSSDPIQINQTQYLQDLIDDGCTMMTFYGHAAGSAFDVSTDAPENYTNVGKYPVVLAQSCLVGDIHSPVQLLNERFVLAKQKAAIAFMAVPDKAYANELDVYSTEFHKQIFSYAYGSTLGEAMKQTVNNVITTDPGQKGVCMNYTLHADPAIKMNNYPKRELSISDQDIQFSPSLVSTQTESFTVNVIVSNLAKTDAQPFQLKLTRTFPDGKSTDTLLIVTSVNFKDTFAINLDVDFLSGAGLNTFSVFIDEDNFIDEYENNINNHATSQLIINSTDINPVYPQEFAIIPTGTVSLKATTANLFASPRNYRFELDTNDHFNSLIHSGLAANASGIVNYNVPFNLDSNRVYYWRVSNDSITSADTSISNRFQWKKSSFIYKPGITGWSQAHFHQFRNDNFTNIIYNDIAGGQFDFVSDSNSIRALNYYYPILGNADPGLYLNNALIEGGGCGAAGNSFALMVLDSIDNAAAWNTELNFLGQFNTWDPGTATATCRSRYERYFLFPYNNTTYVNNLVSALIDSIPCGNYFILWSGRTGVHGDFNYSSVQTPLFNALSTLGATNVNMIQNKDIFLCFGRKCYPSLTIFQIGDSANINLEINTLIGGRWNKGYINSSLIGPAQQWNSLHWGYHSTEAGPNLDSISLTVFGINAAGDEIELIDSISASQLDVNLNNVIDASTYPYLKLRAFAQDLSSNPTPPHLDKWQLFYQPVPEGSLNTKYYSLKNDTVEEGATVSFSIAFENISTVSMDTLLVNYFIYDNNNFRHNLAAKKLHRPLPAGDTIMAVISFSSLGYAGSNMLWVEVNPNNDQPEQYHFNNITSIPFFVKKDNTNPLLDVTFDGIHILNGDIVSGKPGILIQLRDENKFIALNDTSNFRVRLQYPDETTIQYLHFEQNPSVSTSNKLLKWTPAVLPKNSFKIEYFPQFAQDGVYKLIVSATDESGNLSGANDYSINFEIINRSTITNVINYPNPFSTATKFVFVLTGSEIPQDFNIQIMTVTGKIVRTITRSELGNIHIGRNITDYAWDGRDEFGDRLANGVYLYRVVTRINDEKIERRETSADQYFTKEWGKMYLMR